MGTWIVMPLDKRLHKELPMAELGQHLFTFAVIADTHMRPEEGDESSPFEVNLHANGRARYVVELLNQLKARIHHSSW